MPSWFWQSTRAANDRPRVHQPPPLPIEDAILCDSSKLQARAEKLTRDGYAENVARKTSLTSPVTKIAPSPSLLYFAGFHVTEPVLAETVPKRTIVDTQNPRPPFPGRASPA